ncbi:hypothetical protein DBR11_18655 [Pedobacter sp. HMWF019]|uniref:hypothetical protein n=1 Tax=Pedobacter sp. HMWF019 TaxID=2056856 RepID=UPI000D39694C|nr:hypothetical protein [Pedobacter sp. HMWF019]PTS96758.1 hypothetical protein DBR11_18655 [Pedobacter sp. HMWF019]
MFLLYKNYFYYSRWLLLGGDLLLMESALAVRRKERLFLSVRGSKGVWGMEDSPTTILRSTMLPQASSTKVYR